MKQRGASVVHSQKHTSQARPQSHNLWRHIRTTTFGCAPKMGYEETITGFTALWISVYLIILPILNFISVLNEIFVGICKLNLLIFLIFIFILFRNILNFSNLKFSHFSDCIYVLFWRKYDYTYALQVVYWACTKIYLKGLKRSWNIWNRDYRLQDINDSNELRLEWERGVICKEGEYWEKTEGFFITDCFMRFFISRRE